MKARRKPRKETKKEVSLTGNLLQPLSIKKPAIFITSEGDVYRTSPVAAIRQMTAADIFFETENTHYHLTLSPYPTAAIIPMHMGQAMCA